MNGVEILSSETIYKIGYYSWPVWVMVAIVFAIAIITFVYSRHKNDRIDSLLYSLMALAISLMILGLPMEMLSQHKTDEILDVRLKVTIDDSVSMNEFLDKYEILDQEGKIYTVREK